MRLTASSSEQFLDDLELNGELEDDWDVDLLAGEPPEATREQYVDLESLKEFESVGSGDPTQWAAGLAAHL